MTQSEPRVVTQMLIRRPAAEVFEAFVDPAVTTQFWFTHSSGRLEPGKEIRWDWEMYGVFGAVHVKAVDPHRRILIEWADAHGVDIPVEWTFEPREAGTVVTITTSGFSGGDAVAQAIDNMGGFTMVLAGCKALLEHNIHLNLVGDAHPDAIKK
ncbi:MAG: Activator of Hsp90 ATPase 1 family protein [Symbiobacteriaceae bacterium]|jgi:uncharacterized protein YndB with AHSA1/START domain|nr:Activator of Hsp90 ATPase 1 family protein [Symbiobacteriaceae bacterium]